MTTLSRDNSETSVTFSLAELARIEEERLREEETRRAAARERAAREQQDVAARRRAEEEARIAAMEEARARAAREEAEAKARAQAREQAALTVARIEAEGRARLEAENAGRAHELAMLRVRTESGGRRLKLALGVLLGVMVLGGAGTAIGVSRQVASVEQEMQRLREDHAAAAKERDQAKASELSGLDRRLEALIRRPVAIQAKDVAATAQEARRAIDVKALEHGRLHAFAEAVEALQGKVEALERIEALDGRLNELDSWASQKRKSEAAAAARAAAKSAKVTVDDSAIRAYETALNQLHATLAAEKGGAGSGPISEKHTGPACDPNSPLCDLNGRSL